ncbi:MAG: hypothetical protein H7263_15690, partial [Candidatus Sericytochromatia bacterium]|nr:hypothetical protein [Candidatus Sericytochromatia bacterium]
MSGINTNNYASQVPSTFGVNRNANNNSSQSNTSSTSSTQSGDKYSVDSTSNAFDQAMGKLTGKGQNVFSAQNAGTTNPTVNADGSKNLPANVSQEEMNWALLLEQKVSGGYQPNAQETQAYQNVAAKLSSNTSNPQTQTSSAQQTAPAGASQEEINWALGLEQKVKSGYNPTDQETQAYQNIATKLSSSKSGATQQTNPTQQTAPAGASQEEINWALGLEQKVKTQNYQPNAQETQAYQNIAAKLTAAKSGATQQTNPTQQTAPAGASQE